MRDSGTEKDTVSDSDADAANVALPIEPLAVEEGVDVREPRVTDPEIADRERKILIDVE